MDFKVDINQDYRGDLTEYFLEYFMELKVFSWTQEWSGLVSSEV